MASDRLVEATHCVITAIAQLIVHLLFASLCISHTWENILSFHPEFCRWFEGGSAAPYQFGGPKLPPKCFNHLLIGAICILKVPQNKRQRGATKIKVPFWCGLIEAGGGATAADSSPRPSPAVSHPLSCRQTHRVYCNRWLHSLQGTETSIRVLGPKCLAGRAPVTFSSLNVKCCFSWL